MRKLILIILLLVGLSSVAQNIGVKSFRALPSDMTASSLEGKRIDQNGEVAALIRIVTTETGFTFEGGTLGIVDTKQRVSEIWVWVPHGLRRISIFHPQLGVLRDYVFPIEIEAERTYEMVLVTGRVETVVKPSISRQFLVFRLNPPDALLTVDGEPWVVRDGTAERLVSFGTHEYRLEAIDHHPTAGRVEVNDPDKKVIQDITLRANYGFLKIEGDAVILRASSVYVDQANGNEAALRPMRLKSGKHSVRVIHPKYKPIEETIEIEDGETLTFRPEWDANFVTVTLKVDADAEIYLDGERLGARTWTGEVTMGRHIVECRKAGHRPYLEEKPFTKAIDRQTLTLPSPTPILGAMSVSSEPSFATLFVDGKALGETPLLLNELIVGKHHIRLEKAGYEPLEKEVTIEENDLLELSERMVAKPKPKPKDKPKEDVPSPQEKKPGEEHPHSTFVAIQTATALPWQPMYGFSVGALRKVGWFAMAMSNVNFAAYHAIGQCDGQGLVDGQYPRYTGKDALTRLSVTGGVVLQATPSVFFRAGAGFGTRQHCLGITDGHADSWVIVAEDRFTGADVVGGMMLRIGRVTVGVDAITTNFKTIEVNAGVGVRF